MKKIFLAVSVFILSLFALAPLVLAADLDVSCDSGGCSSVGSKPLFHETNIMPAWSVTKTVKAINNYGEERDFAIETVNFSNLGSLGDILKIVIKESGSTANLYDDTLSNLNALGYKILSAIVSGGTKTYDFTVSLPSWVGNDYQGKTLTFDLNLGFESLPAPTSTPTPTPGAAPAGPTATPLPCAATIPTSAPVLSVVAGVNTVNLSWTAVSPVTHYAIQYGVLPGTYLYGAANVGNVTSYVVSGLSSGTTYYFQVMGVNDCAPGPWSNEASAAPTGTVLGAGPAPGFAPVLGASTPSGELKGTTGNEAGGSGKVAGAGVKRVCPWWWVVLLLQMIVQAVYYYLIRKKEVKNWWIFPLLVSIIGFFAHEKLHQGYLPSRFCPYFWLLDLLILMVFTAGYYEVKKEEK